MKYQLLASQSIHIFLLVHYFAPAPSRSGYARAAFPIVLTVHLYCTPHR